MEHVDRQPVGAGNPYAWANLGVWNLYFLAKLALVWTGALNFHVLPNLLFAAALLLPLRPLWLRRLRTGLAIPFAVALFYYDTWWPPFVRLLAQPDVLDFSPDYLLELLGRFVDWPLLGLLALVVLAYVLLKPWLRLTTLSVLGLLGLSLASLPWPQGWRPTAVAQAAQSEVAVPQGPADAATLNAYLQDFHRQESARQTQFPATAAHAAPFDLIVLNICSLAWSDLDQVGLRENALLSRMDVVFDRFNSATSYIGPAAIRLLRASCGQPAHTQLYQSTPAECHLFEDLGRLGFRSELAMNHDGHFDDFISELRQEGGLDAPALDIASMPRGLEAFDRSPIRRDRDVLQSWWQRRQGESDSRVALFYNTITLHDGNRIVGADGSSSKADYRARASLLIEDISGFIDALQRSGRRAMVVIVPEHGAGLHGDRMQIPGMREIPSPSITHVPVGVKLVGMGGDAAASPLHVAAPSSYLALSELVSRVYAASAAGDAAHYDWNALLRDLPQTAPVSENEGAKVLTYAGKPYVQLQGKSDWMPYPQDLP